MTQKKLFGIIGVFGILGVAMSGYLSYWNLWGPSCHASPLAGWLKCGGVALFGYPTCVYGFFVFSAATILAIIGFVRPAVKTMRVIAWIGLAGTLFSASLSVYELFFYSVKLSFIPACVYGLLLFMAILMTALAGVREKQES